LTDCWAAAVVLVLGADAAPLSGWWAMIVLSRRGAWSWKWDECASLNNMKVSSASFTGISSMMQSGEWIICFFLKSSSHIKMENLTRDRTPQLSPSSKAHLDVKIRLFADSGKYIASSSTIVYLTSFSSVIVNFMEPMPNAIELPATPVTPTFGAGRMLIKRLSSEQI